MEKIVISKPILGNAKKYGYCDIETSEIHHNWSDRAIIHAGKENHYQGQVFGKHSISRIGWIDKNAQKEWEKQ